MLEGCNKLLSSTNEMEFLFRDGPLFFSLGGGGYQELFKKLFAQSKLVKKLFALNFLEKTCLQKRSTLHLF